MLLCFVIKWGKTIQAMRKRCKRWNRWIHAIGRSERPSTSSGDLNCVSNCVGLLIEAGWTVAWETEKRAENEGQSTEDAEELEGLDCFDADEDSHQTV